MGLEKVCADNADPDVVEAELLDALESLGIEYQERMTSGYDTLMNEYLARKG